MGRKFKMHSFWLLSVEMICAIAILGMHIVDINSHSISMHSHCPLHGGPHKTPDSGPGLSRKQVYLVCQMMGLSLAF